MIKIFYLILINKKDEKLINYKKIYMIQFFVQIINICAGSISMLKIIVKIIGILCRYINFFI